MRKKKHKKKLQPSQYVFLILAIALVIELAFIYSVDLLQQQKVETKVIPGENLEEALFYNQCDFYNFLLKANEIEGRFNCKGVE